ncbi:Ig-like domain-containing protein [Mesobacillus subterraneus]|uniref:Ig-like domain-containing protein n=1 Tax=Mesobacillus subterraneus TaxID=285983 RepID=UPI002041A469|nr:Ig-like domain-containing protein [Mesobacillus subterraneus]MCM3575938.1 Ig-like domain-containing protein [Mesobacillus subterraneus]
MLKKDRGKWDREIECIKETLDSLIELVNEHEERIGQLENYRPPSEDCGNGELIAQLRASLNQRIQLILPASPPGARRPNITGRLIEVTDEIARMQISSEHEEPGEAPLVGVYQIRDIIGFVPATEGGCEEDDPLTEPLQNLIGRRLEVYTSSQAEPVTGVLVEVTDSLIRLEVDNDQGGTDIVTLRTSEITRYVDRGRPDPGTEPGQVILSVTVLWPEGVPHPDEVNVSLIREDVITVVRTVNGVATFATDPSGDVAIRGEDIPGFITPAKQIRLIGRQKFVTETLEYVASDIPVAGIRIDSEPLVLLVGEQGQLTATILPENANNQGISWESSNTAVATVNDQGVVTATSEGTAIITAISDEGGFTASTSVTVSSIQTIIDPHPITAVRGQVVVLPETVSVVLSNGSTMNVPVSWQTASGDLVGTTFVIPLDPAASYTLIGEVENTNLTAELLISVDPIPEPAVPVTGVSVEPTTSTLFVGSTLQLTATVSPENATTKDVIWSSSDTNVANVSETGLVTAISPGFAVITAETVDGSFTAFAQLTVSAVPEIELIYPTQEVFASAQEVMINVENLVEYTPILVPTTYYVRVEQSGSNRILGEGQVIIGPETTAFNLYTATLFQTTQNFSARYFVSMSTDPDFPPEEDLTLRTNFTIGTAVPTVPQDNINVTKEIIGGPRDGQPGNITFILARELSGIDIADLSWEDYWDSTTGQFTDEVKMIGMTNEEGIVIWEEPRETLKLGGYVLLEVTPPGYVDNLNLINPESEDGSLMKEVRLSRNAVINRNVINTYVGEG